MAKRKVRALDKVEADLTALQNKCRRDPQSYVSDFEKQYRQYQSLLSLFLHNPVAADDSSSLVSLRELIDFVAHVADSYPKQTTDFPADLINILHQHHAELEYELREKIVGSLVLLRNKDIVDSNTLFNALFPILLSTPSKQLRALLFQKILSDLRSSNSKTKNHKLNRYTQTRLFELVTADRESPQGLWSVKITRELWKRQVWTEAKAAEIMKEAALSDNPKISSGGVRFFLGGDKEREEAADESDSDDDGIDIRQLKHQAGINKKTKKKERELKDAVKKVKRKEKKKKNAPHLLNFSALHLLHDPQGFAEQLFEKHLKNAKSRLDHEQKLECLSLVTRLVGLHKLSLDSLYSWFIKYLNPRQQSVTSYLASLAQATHNLVPPDMLEPLVLKIANEFISEASASEVCSAGMNAVREICARQPLAMSETLLQDLVQYRKSKDKGVMMAAKGLLSLYREVGAEMLKRRDRGRDAALDLRSGEQQQSRFGEEAPGEIEGIELLEKWKEEERVKMRIEQGLDPDGAEDDQLDEQEWDKWDIESDSDSDGSGGWIDVESDGENIEVSDSEDEKGPAKKKTKLESVDEEEDAKENDAEITITEKKISTLATTSILTPADLAKLHELRNSNTVLKSLRKTHHQKAAPVAHEVSDVLTAEDISAPAALSHKATKEEKIAAAKGDRQDKHVSSAAKRKEKKLEQGKSTTNKEKARKKNFLMTLGKAKRKGKRSLVQERAILKGHIERKKRGGRRGNK